MTIAPHDDPHALAPLSDSPRLESGGLVRDRPTMADVALAAGVSLKTVSRVVNNEPRVATVTRARVHEAIDLLGFQRNDLARHLARGQSSSTLGLVIEDVGNPFSSSVAAGVEEVARQHGCLLMIASSTQDPSREQSLVAALCQRRVDGLLMISALTDHAYLRNEQENGTPIVFLDRPPVQLDADAVLLDDLAGAYRGTQYLIAQGHRRIGVLGGSTFLHTPLQRLAGYTRALSEAGIPFDASLICYNMRGSLDAEVATAQLLARPDPPTAIFSINNRLSIGVIRAQHALHCQLSLLGFDDFELADHARLPIAILRHDPVEMGRQGAKLLFKRLAGDESPPQRIILPVELVIKGSGE